MNLIVAVDIKGAIGKGSELLDHFSCDLRHFKELTTNKVVVMGKNTFLSLPKHPLPNRTNIVLSSSMEDGEGYTVCHNLGDLFKTLDNYNDEDVFVIGGEKIYSLLFPYCNRFYVTKILKTYEDADKFFKEYKELSKFREDMRVKDWKTVQENGTVLDFFVYERDI